MTEENGKNGSKKRRKYEENGKRERERGGQRKRERKSERESVREKELNKTFLIIGMQLNIVEQSMKGREIKLWRNIYNCNSSATTLHKIKVKKKEKRKT